MSNHRQKSGRRGKHRRGKVPETSQAGFGFSVPPGPVLAAESGDRSGLVFAEGSRRLFVGDMPLRDYLLSCGLHLPVVLADLIGELDVSAFIAAYKPGGRPPVHPRLVIGLLVYGIWLKHSTLREFEALARRDVGAWLLCGGLHPDHSTIGNFIVRHEALLSDQFFVSATQALAKKLGLRDGEAGLDGTIVQAASGLRSIAKKETLEEEAAAARKEADSTQDDALAQRAARLEQAVEIATERAAKREEMGRPFDPKVARTEPEAVTQPLKGGGVRPAYKPSVIAHEGHLIIGQTVEPASEVAAVAPMLKQVDAIGITLTSLAVDGGYFEVPFLRDMVERDIDVVCAVPRRRKDEQGVAITKHKLYAKAAFTFDADRDLYRCPAGNDMTPGALISNKRGASYRNYATRACTSCPLRANCTSSKTRRTIKRFEGEEFTEAMAYVMTHPQARERLQRRSTIVEPIFAELKERLGLRRFRRRHLKGVRVEFALHCLAFNLKRAAIVVVLAVLRVWRPGAHTIGAIGWAIIPVAP